MATTEAPKRKENDLAEIAMIIDRSGSMSGIWDDACGGYTTFIKDQQNEEGRANFTLVTFDTTYDVVYQHMNIQDVDTAMPADVFPRGGTALNDAIGKTIGILREQLAKSNEKPGAVIIAIVTDGNENSSKELTTPQAKKLIEEMQNEHDWHFIYLAANQIAEQVAHGSYGIHASNAMSFASTSLGTQSGSLAASKGMRTIRGAVAKGQVIGSSFLSSNTDKWHTTEAEVEKYTADVNAKHDKKKKESEKEEEKED